ncbi:MAG: T9SS type A sorting domain-containing protein [Candidatus Kapabacteria bacterium]|nr:T9SS type A sorting domain-containing protein [Candidatus Kapabacteria bacterium]
MKKYFVLILLLLAFYLPSHAETSDTIWTHYINGYEQGVKFSPEGKYVYAVSSGYVTKIEVETNKTINVFNPKITIHSMDLSQDGKYLLLSGDTALVIVNAESGEIFKTFVYPFYLALDKDDYITIHIKTVSFSYDGKYCGIVYNGGNPFTKTNHSNLIVWDVGTGKVVLNRNDDNLVFESLVFSPTENIFAVKYGHPNQNNKVPIDVYELGTWKLLKQFEGHVFETNGIKFSKNGNFLASWGNNEPSEKFKIWDMNTLAIKPNTYAKYSIASIWDLCFLNDSTLIASAEILINSQLRWEFIKINLVKQTKTLIADGQAGIDINSLNSKNLLVTGNYTGVTLLNLDKTLDVISETHQPPIIIYPNPVTKELTVTLSESNNTIINYRIINSTGQIIQNMTSFIQNNTLKVNVSNITNGSYILNLQYSNNSLSYNFIVKD